MGDDMTWGLIARADNRGIGIQTWEYARALNPDKILLVLTSDPRFPDFPERFDQWDVTPIELNTQFRTRQRSLDKHTVIDFLKGLDTVFSVETLYEWDMADWARLMGAKTVIHGNGEFTMHGTQQQIDRGLPDPDRWVWPTPWMLERLPEGIVLPVPCTDRPQTAADPNDDTLRVLHVAGHRAIGDRNGTEFVIDAIPWLRGKIHITVIGQDGALPQLVKHPRPGVTWDFQPLGVEDRWSMYENQHVLLSPRRYGGLSLTTIEAISTGMTVIMPQCSPNEIWPGPRLTVYPGPNQRVPAGLVPTVAFGFKDVANTVNKIASDRVYLAQEMRKSKVYAGAYNWASLEPRYREVLK